MNGVDLGYGIITFILLFAVWEFRCRYNNWIVWNQERRWQRRRNLIEMADQRAEEEYRAYLRRLISDDDIIASLHKATKAIQRFSTVWMGRPSYIASDLMKNYHPGSHNA